jgi:hypothetical protein
MSREISAFAMTNLKFCPQARRKLHFVKTSSLPQAIAQARTTALQHKESRDK